MRIVRWEPFRELEAMQGEMRRLLGQVGGREEERGGTWMPSVDVSETEQELVLAFDVPGVPKERLNVEVEDNTLTVSGTREQMEEREGERFYRRERRFGTFSRSIPLPAGIDESQITADSRDGVLEVRIPKPQQPQPRRIEIGGEQQGGGHVDVEGTASPTATDAGGPPA